MLMIQVTEEEVLLIMLKLWANSLSMLPLILMASSVCACLLTDLVSKPSKNIDLGCPLQLNF